MKRILLFIWVICCVTFSSCKKDNSTSPGSSGNTNCKLMGESTSLSGNNAVYEYAYSPDGNVSSIKRFIGGGYHVLADSMLVFYDHTIRYAPGRNAGQFNSFATSYDANIFTGRPTKASVSITLDGVEQRNYYSYFFFYDNKNRLIKIGEQTNTISGDLEYDLNVVYDDHDNVTSLSYETTTGPRTVTLIPASGYDDKPSPFAGIKNWPLLMHADWAGSDPEPIFSALSKNNLLGYTITGWKRTIQYTYDDKGQPVKRTNTNTTATASYTFEENFNYQCN